MMTGFAAAARGRVRAAITRPLGLLLAATVAGAAACGSGGDSATGPRGAAGVYSLASVDDYAPPVKIHHGPHFDGASGTFFNQLIVQVTGAEIELDDEGGFTMEFDFWLQGDGTVWTRTGYVEGSYELNGSEIVFWADNLGEQPGTIRNGVIDMAIDFMGYGNVSSYRFER